MQNDQGTWGLWNFQKTYTGTYHLALFYPCISKTTIISKHQIGISLELVPTNLL